MTKLIALTCLVAFANLSQARAAVRNTHPGHGQVAVIGDSLAYGYGADEDSKSAPAKCLQQITQSSVTQLARSGSTSEEILQRVPAALGARVVFVSSGGNDVISDIMEPGKYPEQKTLAEMEQMFTTLLDSGALVLYLGLKPPFTGSERLTKVWELADAKGVAVIDGMTTLWDQPDKMSDGIHPNEQGYKEMCEKIALEVGAHYP